MQQELETITCAHSVSAIRCTLLFSDRDKPSHWFREYLRTEFPIERVQPKQINRGKIEGFRPTRAYFDAEETTFVWQDGRAIFIQTEAPHKRERFLQLLESVVRACAETRPLNCEPLQLVSMCTNRFRFMPYTPNNMDQFELHRYFSFVPCPSAEIRKQGVFLLQNDINQKYASHNGDYIEMDLKFPGHTGGVLDGCVDLEITTLNPAVWWLDTTKDSVTKALDTMHELTHEATTKELHRILHWN